MRTCRTLKRRSPEFAAETLDTSVSRMTIVTRGDDKIIEQILKQLNKLINVALPTTPAAFVKRLFSCNFFKIGNGLNLWKRCFILVDNWVWICQKPKPKRIDIH